MKKNLRLIYPVFLSIAFVGCSSSGFNSTDSSLNQTEATNYNSNASKASKSKSQTWSNVLKSSSPIDSDGMFSLRISPKKPKPGDNYNLIIGVSKKGAKGLTRSNISGKIRGTDAYSRNILIYQKPDEGFLDYQDKFYIIIPIDAPNSANISDHIEVSAKGPAWETGTLRVDF